MEVAVKTARHNTIRAIIGCSIVQVPALRHSYLPPEAQNSANRYLRCWAYMPADYHRNFEGRRNPAMTTGRPLCSPSGYSPLLHITRVHRAGRTRSTHHRAARSMWKIEAACAHLKQMRPQEVVPSDLSGAPLTGWCRLCQG